MTYTSPVWCWLAGLILAVTVELISGNPLRVVAAGLIAYGVVLLIQSLV